MGLVLIVGMMELWVMLMGLVLIVDTVDVMGIALMEMVLYGGGFQG